MAISRLRPVPESRALPRQIGSYEVVNALGVGGMARVYLGLKRGPGTARKLLAIKQVRAEIASLDELSGHADQSELLRWIEPVLPGLRRVFLVHGEPEQSAALARSLEQHGLAVTVPTSGEVFELELW